MKPGFVVYKSSAGSGKTFTLVREYLKLILGNPDAFRQVLAITFTNKAANEMKERVMHNLLMLADPGKFPESDAIRFLLPQLQEQLGQDSAWISGRAAQALSLIMHHYAEFSVSTIDSFTHRVIRTFAHDLRIPLNFEVELDTERMLSEAVDLLISQVGINEPLTRIMVDFVEKKAGDEHNWRIERDLNIFGKNLLSETAIASVAELRNYDLETFTRVRQSLVRWIMAWENAVSGSAAEIMKEFGRAGLGSDDFIYKERGIYGYFRDLAGKRWDRIKPNSYAQKALESGEWVSSKTQDARTAFNTVSGPVLAKAAQISEKTRAELPRYTLCKLILNNLFSTALLGEIEKTLHSLSVDNKKLMISEFNRRISAIVREQPAPFIYERLGERYQHYLIDEFQDTSILQWHNLIPLVENSLASGRANLVVGDAKQAIYRWRAGDARQFEILPKVLNPDGDPLLAEREQTLIRNYRGESLDLNHRSSPLIVDFNNRLFTFIAGLLPDGYGTAYQSVAQTAARSDKPGMVSITCIGKPEDDAGENYSDMVFRKILGIIHEQVEDHFRYSDIAILTRKNDHASAIAAFLVQNNVPVISSESLLLTQSEQVNFLIAWIDHLIRPSAGIPRLHVLEYLIQKGFLTEEVCNDRIAGGLILDEAFPDAVLSKVLPAFSKDKLKRMDVFGIVNYLAYHFRMQDLEDSYLRFFLDAVLEFQSNARGGLPEFREWWDQKADSLSVILPEGIDAVRIMTIHKAKGLQFPVVIYPFADETVRTSGGNLWVRVDDELAAPVKVACVPVVKALQDTICADRYLDEINLSLVDMVNVFYVAMTRPEERLYLLTRAIPSSPEKNTSVPGLLGGFLGLLGIFEEGKAEYAFGQRWQRPPGKPMQDDLKEPAPEARPELKMLLRRHAPETWDMDDPEQNREWGRMLHQFLARIFNASDIEGVVQQGVDSGLLDQQKSSELAALLHGVVEDPALAAFFSDAYDTRNEPAIITADGKIYRPDRVLLKNDAATIIDFKTGKFHEGHREQVRNYSRLLQEMNYRVEAVYLVYLGKPLHIVRVT